MAERHLATPGVFARGEAGICQTLTAVCAVCVCVHLSIRIQAQLSGIILYWSGITVRVYQGPICLSLSRSLTHTHTHTRARA